MGRTFDNNAANYMSRGSVNLGLEGATACSFGFWINITATVGTHEQRIVQKEINGLDSWSSIYSSVITSTSTIKCSVQRNTTTNYPEWATNAGIGTGTWTRVLFAWERTAGAASTDASIYVNGVEVATTHKANGYTNTFTIQENSSNLYYGIRPITLTQPLNASLAWGCVWNRKLTAQEAVQDYDYPGAVTSGLIHCVKIKPDKDRTASGFDMTVTGTLAAIDDGKSRYWLSPTTWT